MATETYGFVGLGRMGGPMSSRLLERQCQVHVFDRDHDAVARAEQRGAKPAASAAEVASRAATVFISLPTPDIVRSVALGEGGLIEGSAVRHVVDLSTTGPRIAALVSAGLAERGITLVDSPVSGGVSGARDGTLAVMVACPRPVFEELEAALATFGRVFFVGEKAGLGQTMKLCNNLLSAAALAVSAESMVMGVKAGLDPRLMLDIINAGSGRNSATQDKFPRSVLPGTFDFGFETGLLHKDIRLCLDEGEALGVPMVVGSAVRQMLAVTSAVYGTTSDFTSIVRVVEDWAGTQVRG